MDGREKRSNFSRKLGVLAAFFFLFSPLGQARSAQNAWTLPQILKHLDEAARSFRTLSAHVERTKVTVVVNDRSTESGMIYVERDGRMRLNVLKPNPRTVLRLGDNLYVYNPLMSQVVEYDLSKHREMVDQFLLLGFGTRAHDLEKAYLMSYGGEQTLDNRETVLLNLTPQSEAVRNQISQIQLWIDESNWLPVRQKFQETGTPDYFTIRYSNIVRNANLKSSLFKADWPKGTQKIKPGN